MCNLQRRLDTYFNKDNHRTVLYFLVYDQENEKQNDLGPELLVCCLAHRGPTGVFLLLRS